MDFGIYEASASRIIRKVEDILIDSGKFELPKKLSSRVDEDIDWTVSSLMLPKPQLRDQKKREYYSGNRKQHTLKAQVIVHWKTGLILAVQTCRGSVHDFKLYKDTCPNCPLANAKVLADSGYRGIANLHAQTFTPFKKLRGGNLLELCKQANQYLAKFRIMFERKICLIKLFKMVANSYRNRCQRYDFCMKSVLSLFKGQLRYSGKGNDYSKA